MKYCLWIILLMGPNLYGQIVLPVSPDIRSLKPILLQFEKKAHSEAPVRFTSIAVQDLRTDTITTGYVRLGTGFSKFYRLQFENGISSARKFLNKYFNTGHSSDSLRLIVLLKQFFITSNYKAPSTGVNLVNDVHISKIFLKAHLVLEQNNKRFLLGDVDTVLTLNKWLGHAYNKMAQTGLTNLVERAAAYFNTMQLTILDDASLKQLTKLPLPFPDSLQDGFYTTYNDFLAGHKKEMAVQLKQLKNNRRLLRASTAQDAALMDSCWGFVEKGILYVHHQKYFIPLQHTFGSWSGLGVDAVETDKMLLPLDPLGLAVDVADIAINGPTIQNEPWKLFKLNFETGKLE